jgi:hypothetical protein
MPISVSYFGKNKPGPGVKPVRVDANVKTPFGKKNPVNWWNGKHVPLHREETGTGGGSGSSHVEIEYSTITHVLRYRTGTEDPWITIDEAVPLPPWP